jgi:RNA polymerase primary sigma factor
MDFSSHCKEVIDIVFLEYKENGFITEKRILELSRSRKLSFFEINTICEYIFSNGVYLFNETLYDDFVVDYAHIDYEDIYNEIIKIDTNLTCFVNYVRNIKAPQKREPQKLLPQIKDGNIYARNRLFEMYLRIVLKMALRYHKKYGFSLADTIQEGAIGLIIALDKYEYGSSGKFSTYAPWWIRQTIFRNMSFGNILFTFPVRIKNKMFKICHILIKKSDTEKHFHHKKIINRVCHILSCSEQKAVKYIGLFNAVYNFENIPDYIAPLLSDNEETSLGIFQKTMDDLFVTKIKEVLSTLPKREQKIIKMRYGIEFEESYTLEEIGEKLNLTKERIRQIENNAMKKLRYPARSRELKDFFRS